LRRHIYLAALPLVFDALVALLLATGGMPGQAQPEAAHRPAVHVQGFDIAFVHWDRGASVN
jgi:hypothetical protein